MSKEKERYSVGAPPPIEAYKIAIIHMIQAERDHVQALLEKVLRYMDRVEADDFRDDTERRLMWNDIEARIEKYINAVSE